MSVIIGLTGPTGSGKSSVAAVAEALGLKVINCDKSARDAVLPGSEGLKAVVAAFGEEMLLPDGTLNRKALAHAAFSSPQKTELLNKTLLPHISRLVLAEIGDNNVLLDAPTLFESGLDSICTKTIAVLADVSVRRKRIIARDGLSAQEADTRINAGKADEYYLKRADYALYNNGNLETFCNEISLILKNIFGGNKNV